MTWQPADSFERARWQESLRRLGRTIGSRAASSLLDLNDVQERLGLFQQSYGGLKPIPVDKIVGSVAKSNDFDRDFRPRTDRVKQRWEQVSRAFPAGDFPPIQVYKVDETYHVIDGHHRVGIARAKGIEFIDAEITELHSPYELDPDTDLADIIHLQQRKLFLEESGLGKVRPDARIEFSRPVGYVQLLENLEVYGYTLLRARGEILTREAVAADWYDNVYLVHIAAIEDVGLSRLMPGTPISDLYLWVHRRRQDLFPDRGHLSFKTAAGELAEQETKRLSTRARVKAEQVEEKVSEVVDRLLGKEDGPAADG